MNRTSFRSTLAPAVLAALAAPALAASPAPDPHAVGHAIFQAQCVKCHGEGLKGAPRVGDRAAWIDRARLGIDKLVNSAIRGHGAMPARGGLAQLTDPEIREVVTYMVSTSLNASP